MPLAPGAGAEIPCEYAKGGIPKALRAALKGPIRLVMLLARIRPLGAGTPDHIGGNGFCIVLAAARKASMASSSGSSGRSSLLSSARAIYLIIHDLGNLGITIDLLFEPGINRSKTARQQIDIAIRRDTHSPIRWDVSPLESEEYRRHDLNFAFSSQGCQE